MSPCDQGFEIELRGEIVAMVALGQNAGPPNAKQAALDEAARCSVKVVAGARYQLFRTPVSAFVPIPG